MDENKEKQEVVYNIKENDSDSFQITRVDDKNWRISGDRIERFYKRTNISTDEGLMYFVRTLRKMGIEDELRNRGIQNGHIVKICDFEFEYYD
jgi:GTP-binding protein